MPVDRNGLEVLTRDECVRLLSTARVGRVGLSVDALPVVLPVNFAVMDGAIVIRSGPGTKFDSALSGSVVAFEVDQVDYRTESGWSVLVQGVAAVIADPEELDRARSLALRPWSGGIADQYVKITTEIVTGRRLSANGNGHASNN